jgi:hypothetical protein
MLVWPWRTVADPNLPGERISHPLAGRFGDPCRLVCEGRKGGNRNRLVEFADGLRVVAPLYATRRP